MKDRRLKRFWYRAGPLAAASALFAGGAVMGCGSDSPTTTTSTSGMGGTSPTTSVTGTGGASTSGTGGEASTSSSSTGAGGAHAFAPSSVGDAHRPFDATPTPDGKEIYFTQDGANGLGVYKVFADGTEPKPVAVYPTAVDPNNPFAAPFGIAMSTDGKTVYVAETANGTSDRGGIYAIPAAGGVPSLVAGTDGVAPRGLDVVAVSGKDVIYFSGIDPKNVTHEGVYSISADGGAVTTIAEGGLLIDPSGIVVAKNGDIYVVNTIASDFHASRIVVIPAGGAPKTFLDDLRVGYPAGAALSFDEKTLYVSGFNPQELTDRLLGVDVATAKSTELFQAELGTFTESGGIHRARSGDIFALVDSSAGPTGGKVFVIK